MNLLVGLAVSDIQGLNKSARLHQLLQQVIVIWNTTFLEWNLGIDLKWKGFKENALSGVEILNHSQMLADFSSQFITFSKVIFSDKFL